jgi:endonuclease/exonuclease/phosphatase family metal-dependent hydrolase
MLVLTWNLFHGRSLPSSRRSLHTQFAAALAAWEWDVALLQEVPPWWPAALASAAGAQWRHALTSRNALLPLRRALARRRPELLKSNGGGCNAILSRGAVAEHASLRLRRWPERRVAQLARLADGTCVANFHASTRTPLAEEELRALWRRALAWAGDTPLVLAGDLNLRAPAAPSDAGILHVAERDVDHVFARGFAPASGPEPLDRRAVAGGATVELSDHPPLRARLSRTAPKPHAKRVSR